MTELSSKLESLEKILSDMQSVLIAYSGGTDSTFLLKDCGKPFWATRP